MTLNKNFITLFYMVLNVVSFRLTDHGERENFPVQVTVHDGTDMAHS
jgi:hypothetical protein